MVDIEKIEQALRDGLEGVTAGEWEAGSGWVFVEPKDGYRTSPLRHILRDVPADEIQANCDYIAAARPENIRALLDELPRLREALKPFAGEKLPSSRKIRIAYNRHGLRCAMSDLEIAQDAAARVLSERKGGQANG